MRTGWALKTKDNYYFRGFTQNGVVCVTDKQVYAIRFMTRDAALSLGTLLDLRPVGLTKKAALPSGSDSEVK